MTFVIELSRQALKNLARLPKRELLHVRNKINELSINPRSSFVKKIRGDENLYRIRCENYRILYRIFEEKLIILIVDVDHRKDVYRSL